ncbi:hypothetical protein PVAND_013595 [Polypedilum vanderplanki]|uniref:Uncharacterized protein n=1 Tax=Polypedilum vanderplanki TaxID=319348 RepID=A0A9J6CQY1_POLVA|nr:hypothetical protein PVAND_013595 [Polypedilum vanderplanki]
MFYNVGMRHGAHHSNDYHRYWNEKQDQIWRATTQGPYFENKIPTEDDKVLPASAVIGAATAFGLASLLPLKVPASKPLMYCGKTELMQALIRIENDAIYECKNEKFVQLFPQNPKNSTNLENSIFKEYKNIEENEENSTNNSVIYFEEKSMLCEEEKYEGIFCKNGILLSSDEIFCNSTVIFQPTNSNKTIDILNCYKGEFPENQSSFIPTISTEAPINTEKSLSVIESLWIPVALEILPETTTEATTTTTTPESPFDWIKTIRTPELCYNQFYLTC